MKTADIHRHDISTRLQKLFVGLALLAAMSTGAIGETSPEDLWKRMDGLEKSLFVNGKLDYASKPLPEAEQRKVLDAIFPTLTSVAEKRAFLGLLFPKPYPVHPMVINQTIFGEYAAKLLKDADAGVRSSAAGGLGSNGMRQFSAEVVPLLDDPDQEVRIQAVRALGFFARHDLTPRMASIARSAATKPEREAGLTAIGQLLRDPTATVAQHDAELAVILKYLDENPTSETGLSLIGGLLHDTTVTAAQHDAEMAVIVKYLDENARIEMRCVALGWLAGVPDADKHLDLVLKLMTKGDVRTRRDVVKVLAFIPGKSATEALLAALKDSEEHVRRVAAAALASLDHYCGKPGKLRPPTKTAAAEIALLLEDKDKWVRCVAVESLVGLDATDYAEAIAKHVGDPENEVCERAIKALATMKAVKFAHSVAAQLNDADSGIRIVALRTLCEIGTREQTQAVVARATDKSYVVRLFVIGVLKKFDARDQHAAIEKLAQDENKDVAYSAKELLTTWDKKPPPRNF